MSLLPNLAGLDLRAHEAAPTAEFFSLDADQQQQLVAAGDVEMFSQEPPEAFKATTFRVAKTRNARTYIMTDYDWYDGRQLWQWAQTHELDPLRKPWWYEDWLELRAWWAPGSGVPNWVNSLPQLDPSVPKQVLPPRLNPSSSSQETVMAPNDDGPPPSPLAPRRLDFGAGDDSPPASPPSMADGNQFMLPQPLRPVRQPGEREYNDEYDAWVRGRGAEAARFLEQRPHLPPYEANGRWWTHTWERGWEDQPLPLELVAQRWRAAERERERQQSYEDRNMMARRSLHRQPDASEPSPFGFRSLHDNGNSWP